MFFNKKYFILFLMIYCASCFKTLQAQESAAPWLTEFDIALQKAASENKYLLLNFSGSDWCANCIRMEKEIFSQEEFIEFAQEHLILVKADFPVRNANKQSAALKAQNEKLAEKYNAEGAFPNIIILDKNEKIKWHSGYYSGGKTAFVAHLTQLLHE